MSQLGRFLKSLPRLEAPFGGQLLAATMGRAESVDWGAGTSALVFTLPFNGALVAASVNCVLDGGGGGAASTIDVQVNGAGADLTGSALDIPTEAAAAVPYTALASVLTGDIDWVEYKPGTEFHVTLTEVIGTEPESVYVTLFFIVRGKPGEAP